MTLDGDAKDGHGGVFASASLDATAGEVVLKLVNPGAGARDIALSLDGVASPRTGRAFTLTGPEDAENSLATPTAIAPTSAAFELKGATTTYSLAPYSITVLRVRVRAS